MELIGTAFGNRFIPFICLIIVADCGPSAVLLGVSVLMEPLANMPRFIGLIDLLLSAALRLPPFQRCNLRPSPSRASPEYEIERAAPRAMYL